MLQLPQWVLLYLPSYSTAITWGLQGEAIAIQHLEPHQEPKESIPESTPPSRKECENTRGILESFGVDEGRKLIPYKAL